MPFDPAQPANHSPLVSQVIRDNLLALFNLIQSIPAGPPGPQGIQGIPGQAGVNGQDGQPGAMGLIGLQGPAFAQAIVDAVNTLNPGEPANVSASFDGTNVHLTFDLPRGADGLPGQAGQNGQDGLAGPPGPPFTNFLVGTVTTLPPGDQATAAAMYDGTAVQLSLGIPRGLTGAQGPALAAVVVDSVTTLNPGENATAQSTFDGSTAHLTLGLPRGADGGQGLQGNQGPPGEVTAAQLASAITGTSSNSNGVSTLDTPFVNDPPTQADLETLRVKMNELILALRR